MSKMILHQQRCVWRLAIVLLVFISLVSGCNGNVTTAAVGTGGTGDTTTVVAGKVADGYLANVTVFLDKNGNYQLDTGEPYTTTDANGSYTLIIDSLDVGKYPIVALAIKGVAIDKDNNQTIANSFVLSMPKDSVSGTVSNNFISPISTQLREMLETGIYTTPQQAADILRVKMGLPAGTDVTSDFVTANNNAMHVTAQNIATLMGNQMGLVVGSNGTATTVEVNRYRGMIGTIFSNMSSIRGANVQAGMTNLNSTISAVLPNLPPTGVGQPYLNMSTVFRGKMGMNKILEPYGR